jgi:hypothetical protein
MTKRFSLILAAVFFLCCNGAAQLSIKVGWASAKDADSYRLQVSTDSTFGTTVFDMAGLTDTTRTIPGLAYSTTYYWHVNATNIAGANPWSATWHFRTTPPLPAAVILLFPVNGAIGVKQ